MTKEVDTIVALATPPGRGSIGVIRISGSKSSQIAKAITGFLPKPRLAHFTHFKDPKDHIIDQGIMLFFQAPKSFTGEDIIEFHGHGGPIVLDYLLETIIYHGARLAQPGEFTERAFLNGKIDLTQAEAIADLIDSSTRAAAHAAMCSLQGDFSKKITILLESLVHLRMYVEAAIDFPDEEIDFLNDGHVAKQLEAIMTNLTTVLNQAHQGRLLKEGMKVIILGKPNAGKSSLLNKLTGQESAIVTEIPGTTRDILREVIHIDGVPLHIIDTAGLRTSPDLIEQEGIRRALSELEKADHVLLIVDSQEISTPEAIITFYQNEYRHLLDEKPLTIILNKIDLTNSQPSNFSLNIRPDCTVISLSAKTGAGIELLHERLRKSMGYQSESSAGFIARRRHLDALYRAQEALNNAMLQLSVYKAGELLAEDLRQAQLALSEITGEFSSEDLLTRIFASFCIGK